MRARGNDSAKVMPSGLVTVPFGVLPVLFLKSGRLQDEQPCTTCGKYIRVAMSVLALACDVPLQTILFSLLWLGEGKPFHSYFTPKHIYALHGNY